MAAVGKSVVVTGAGSGIGAATAKRFAADGYAVTLNGRTESKLKSVAAEIGKDDHIHIAPGDVSKPDDCKHIIAAHVQRFGGLDVLVNNAGVAVGGQIDQVAFDDWRKVMSINVDGVFLMIHEAVPHIEKTGGSIVNVSSVSGIGGDWGMSPYNATKGAVTNFTRALALDFGSRGMRINAVAPSLVETDMTEDMVKDDELVAKFADRIPIGRYAQPDEVADVIAFLASHDARFVNGVILPVDGGVTAANGQPNFSA
ncbi:MAG: SDR family oxidoreductase [Pseudomonadota bacterium]